MAAFPPQQLCGVCLGSGGRHAIGKGPRERGGSEFGTLFWADKHLSSRRARALTRYKEILGCGSTHNLSQSVSPRCHHRVALNHSPPSRRTSTRCYGHPAIRGGGIGVREELGRTRPLKQHKRLLLLLLLLLLAPPSVPASL